VFHSIVRHLREDTRFTELIREMWPVFIIRLPGVPRVRTSFVPMLAF